jgi:hypothetical protein
MSTTQQTTSSPTNTPREFPSEWFTVEGFNALFRTDPEFAAFARQVYLYLDRMHGGYVVSFAKYEGKKLEWCIRTAAAYICEGDHWERYSFGDDMVSVHKARDWNWLRRWRTKRREAEDNGAAMRCVHHLGMHVGLNTRVDDTTD